MLNENAPDFSDGKIIADFKLKPNNGNGCIYVDNASHHQNQVSAYKSSFNHANATATPKRNQFKHLKIEPEFFEAVLSDHKTFEIRLNDRDYKVGDMIELWEYSVCMVPHYTSRSIKVIITYITDFKQIKGYVVFSFKKLTNEG